MIRLYYGLVKNGKWFNYTKVTHFKGTTLSLMDSPDNSGTVRLLRIIQGSITSVFTETGEEHELSTDDYEYIKWVDAWKIAREAAKLYTGNDKHAFPEHFFCKTCSSHKNERYTKVEESWDELVEKGFIDEVFIESPDNLQYETVLPLPIEIEGNRQILAGTYNTLIREELNLKQVIQISKNTWANASEANMIFAMWDAQIKSVKGLADRDLTILRRNKEESFTKKYLTAQENVEAMSDERRIGLVANYRSVSCSTCHAEIGGHLDFTNFFSFLGKKKLNHSGHKVM